MQRIRGLAFAVALAVVEAAPALASPRPLPTLVAKQAAKPSDEVPLPTVPSAEDVLALYTGVGRDLRLLAERDLEASNDLMSRYRLIRLHDALSNRHKRRVAARQLVELRHLIAQHAN